MKPSGKLFRLQLPIRRASCISRWLLLAAFGAIACTSLSVQAQQYSADGNRWYEIEMTVFTNEDPAIISTEQFELDTKQLEYFPRLRLLRPAISSFLIDFPDADAVTDTVGIQSLPGNSEVMDQSDTLAPSPLLLKEVPKPYRIDDFGREPYIELDNRFWGLAKALLRLQDSPDHKVLWHATWRAPMLGLAQAPAIAVFGGAEFGQHHQLEGSIRFSDIGGTVRMDLNLWLNQFATAFSGNPSELTNNQLPQAPFRENNNNVEDGVIPPTTNSDARDNRNTVAAPQWLLDAVWQIQQQKVLRSNELYYIDHPAFGVLVEIRPYTLPTQSLARGEEDF